MARALERAQVGCMVGKWRVSGIFFADDLGLLSRTFEGLQKLLMIVQQEGALFNMKISVKKSKVMILSKTKSCLVMESPLKLETVSFYKYSGRGVHL